MINKITELQLQIIINNNLFRKNAIDETTLAEFLNLETMTDWRTPTIIPLLKATLG